MQYHLIGEASKAFVGRAWGGAVDRVDNGTSLESVGPFLELLFLPWGRDGVVRHTQDCYTSRVFFSLV